MSNYKPFAFVLMPFDAGFSDIYKFGIKQTAENLGVLAERVDEQHFSESILERVYRQIDNSDFIIAEMTGKNPNVFYEVGYAHAKGKLCALITQNAADIPFDLKHHPHVVYGGVSKSRWFVLCSDASVMYSEASEAPGDPPCPASIRPNSAACLPA